MKKVFRIIDWPLILSALFITLMGLLTMRSFEGAEPLFTRQITSVVLSLAVFFFLSRIPPKFLSAPRILVPIYTISIVVLLLLFPFGEEVNTAKSWFRFGSFSFQPTDFAKLALILVLAKYFSRRHVEIADTKHIVISAIYMALPFLLVFFQPDFGSSIVFILIWFGMILLSGVSKKHLFLILGLALFTSLGMWLFVLEPYQKDRVMTFLDPYTDVQGAGYNAYQSTIAVGSGEIFGKGVGYGTQSHLKFLPEYETDFIFAAFAEEWGFLGAIILLSLYGILIWRILLYAYRAGSNFELLFSLGVAIFFLSHILINIGMNVGLLPVTGITLPFMSYGGSHLIAEFSALGILMATRPYQRAAHRDAMKNEFVGMG